MRKLLRVDSQPVWDALCPEWKIVPQPEPSDKIKIDTNGKSVYQPGEQVEFNIQYLRDGQPVSGVKLTACLKRDFNPDETFNLVSETNPVVIRTTLDAPGFIRLSVEGNQNTAAWGVGCVPLEIQGADDVEGFDAFWNAQQEKLAAVPPKELLCNPVPNVIDGYEDVSCYDVQVACAGNAPVSGILSMPKDAKPKSLPAYVFFHGAGVRPAFQPLSWAKLGMLAFNVNAHGLSNYETKAYYEEATSITLKDYPSRSSANSEDLAFYGMSLRVLQALKYIKTRPEWDGRILVVHGGSQGGYQTLVACGLDHNVTFVVVNAPAACNLAGALEGRTPSWPMTVFPGQSPEKVKASRLFDGVSFARRAECEGIFTVGFSDGAAVPSSVYAAYNAYAGPKTMMDFPDLGHEKSVFWTAEAEILDHIREMK